MGGGGPAGPRDGRGPVRTLLFTGKGGVGKTTVAAATALRCADAGLRTMVLSTDPAHSLGDAFDLPLSSVGTSIVDGLWGQQLDAQERLEDTWADIQAYVKQVLDWAGVDAIEAEELSVVPGLDEIFALSDIKEATVLERDDGRATVVAFRAAAMGRSARYTLGYDYADAPRQISWSLVRGDIMRRLDGRYVFEPRNGATEVTYELTVDLVVPLPGFVKRRAEGKIIGTALDELKKRVEG